MAQLVAGGSAFPEGAPDLVEHRMPTGADPFGAKAHKPAFLRRVGGGLRGHDQPLTAGVGFLPGRLGGDDPVDRPQLIEDLGGGGRRARRLEVLRRIVLLLDHRLDVQRDRGEQLLLARWHGGGADRRHPFLRDLDRSSGVRDGERHPHHERRSPNAVPFLVAESLLAGHAILLQSVSIVSERNMAATVTSWSGRCDTTISSPAETVPGATTRRYAPGIAASVNVLTQPVIPIHPRNVAQGARGEVTSKTTSSPIVHRSPINAPLTSMPCIVRFSPKNPDVRVRPSSPLPVVEVLARVRVDGLIVAAVVRVIADHVSGEPAAGAAVLRAGRAHL